MAGMPEPLASPGGGADRDCHRYEVKEFLKRVSQKVGD